MLYTYLSHFYSCSTADVQTKKRRKVAEFKQKQATQTVRRSRILQSPLIAGISLLREQGTSSPSQNLETRLSALAKQTQVSDLLSLKQCTNCGNRDTVFDFAIDHATDAIVWGLGYHDLARIQYLSEYALHMNLPSRKCSRCARRSQHTYDIAAFRSSISSVAVTSSRALVATATTSDHPGNVFIAQLSQLDDDNLTSTYPISEAQGAPSYLRLGDQETTLWTSSPNPPGSTDIVAIAASDATYLLDPCTATLLHTYTSSARDMRSLDWLSQNLALAGSPRKKTVLLFDARARGSAARFRHSSGVVAVSHAGTSGYQTLVAGFEGMSLYDLRMATETPASSRRTQSASASLLKMPSFRTERPVVALDVWDQGNVVAVADDWNGVLLHSLSTGKLLAELREEGKKKKKGDGGKGREEGIEGREGRQGREFISRMRFVEGGSWTTPTLVVAKAAKLVEWTFGGGEDDEG